MMAAVCLDANAVHKNQDVWRPGNNLHRTELVKNQDVLTKTGLLATLVDSWIGLSMVTEKLSRSSKFIIRCTFGTSVLCNYGYISDRLATVHAITNERQTTRLSQYRPMAWHACQAWSNQNVLKSTLQFAADYLPAACAQWGWLTQWQRLQPGEFSTVKGATIYWRNQALNYQSKEVKGLACLSPLE